jgi:hypothetical protein
MRTPKRSFGYRAAPGEGDSQRASLAETAPHPNPLPARTGRGRSKHTFAFSRRISPEFCKETSRPPSEGAGNAGRWCARSRACSVGNTRVSHHGHTGNTRHSPRNGFNGLFRALPGDRALLPPSPLRSLLLKNLMPASGHQDHTTLPSAFAPFAKGASASTASRTQRP